MGNYRGFFNREVYEHNLNRSLELHVEWLLCEFCIREFDPFTCSFGAIDWLNQSQLYCPKCTAFLGKLSLSRHNPFVVYR